MKRLKVISLTFSALFFLVTNSKAQRGYYDAPYTRYEADKGTLSNATVTAKSYAQSNVQSEASEQVCVNMPNAGSSVTWTTTTAGDGLVVRYSIPDGQSGSLEVFVNNVSMGTLNLTTYYSWEYLATNGDPNNSGVSNTNPKMRFDEVRMKMSTKVPVGGTLKLVNKSGNINLDFVELETIPAAVSSSNGDAVYSGDGSTLQSFIDSHGGQTIYIPAGVYNVNSQLYFGVANTKLKGAGMWYAQIHFTNTGGAGKGGLTANASNISYSGLYLTTVRNSRTNSYKAINGVYTSGSTLTNLWAEHFECGAWIAQYNTGSISKADGFTMSYCRLRNNYADGINLCKGTSNAIVEHCSFRNNGDDDMAIWSQSNMECQNNTFRYCTSENCWRASGCAIYGGYNNKAQNLLIQDNVEVGLRVGNNFSGSGFNASGMHTFTDITILRCGTFNDLFNSPVGAIDIFCSNVAGTRIQNVKFTCIDIVDSKNDAIYMYKKAGEGFYNVVFENINVNGTGREYPDNNVNNLNWGRGYAVLFSGSPSGNGTYCGMSYMNRGGNATVWENTAQKGTFSWTQAASCAAACTSPSVTTITSASYFGECDNPVTLSATTAAPSGSTVSSIEFFVDGTSVGTDNSSPYTASWNNPSIGTHQVKAVSSYSNGSTSTSSTQTVTIASGIFQATTAPVIDGTIDAMWNSHPAFSPTKVAVGTVTNAADLSATFKSAWDATNLYILVDVTDDILRNDGAANWQDDAIEIYIDMGNDKLTSYQAGSDFQYSFVWGVNTPQTGLTFAQTTKAGNNGYIMEIMIPWATLGGAPKSGDMMGFDLHVEDNDSGDRNGKLVWNDATDNAWQNPSLLGTLQIAGCSKWPSASFTNTTASCTGKSITFTDASTNSPTTWSWDFGSGATPATANTKGPHNVTYSTAGDKTVTLTVSNSYGSNTTTKTITIATTPAQPGTITGTASPCNGSATTYSVADVAGATSYTWALPTGWSGSSSTASISATPNSASGNVSVTANNACGSSTAKTLAVSPSSVPSQPGAISGSASPCSGTSTTYSITAVAGASSYTWTLPSGWSGSSSTVSISANPDATAGNVSVVANNTCGASAARTLAVTPGSTPAQPGTITGPATVKEGSTNTYSVAAVTGATSYTWTLPTGWTGTSSTNSISAIAGSTSGNVSVSASNSCGTSAQKALPVNVTVCSSVAIPAKIEAENYCDMFGVQLEVTSDDGAGQDIGWIDGGDWMSYKINVPQTGPYLVQYRVASIFTGNSFRLESLGGATVYGDIVVPNTGDWQTWQTVSHTVQLNAGVQDIAIATSTGGFNINWIDFSIATGIPEVQKKMLMMYPNPVKDALVIKSSEELQYLEILDAMGRVVVSLKEPGSDFKVDFERLPAGIYTVIVTDHNYHKERSVLVK